MLIVVERRRIAHPVMRRFSKWDYSRELRLAKWSISAAKNPSLSALGFGCSLIPGARWLCRRVRRLRQLRTHSVQGAVRIHETELSHSIVRVTSLTETTLDSATGPFRSDGVGI
jgi:hypothetical protein